MGNVLVDELCLLLFLYQVDQCSNSGSLPQAGSTEESSVGHPGPELEVLASWIPGSRSMGPPHLLNLCSGPLCNHFSCLVHIPGTSDCLGEVLQKSTWEACGSQEDCMASGVFVSTRDSALGSPLHGPSGRHPVCSLACPSRWKVGF